LAVHPMGVRSDRLAPGGGHPFRNTGVDGDPTRATLERGRALLDLKIEAAVNQIQREGQDPSS